MTGNVIDSKSSAIGQRIRTARREASLSTTKLAIALEVDPRTVARWQSGEAMPSVIRLGQIAQVLGKTPGYFLDGEEAVA
jgi:transcriptional regulator with XRE-family HTH domain